jgi:hypothetical protein
MPDHGNYFSGMLVCQQCWERNEECTCPKLKPITEILITLEALEMLRYSLIPFLTLESRKLRGKQCVVIVLDEEKSTVPAPPTEDASIVSSTSTYRFRFLSDDVWVGELDGDTTVAETPGQQGSESVDQAVTTGPPCPVCAADSTVLAEDGGWLCVAGCYWKGKDEEGSPWGLSRGLTPEVIESHGDTVADELPGGPLESPDTETSIIDVETQENSREWLLAKGDGEVVSEIYPERKQVDMSWDCQLPEGYALYAYPGGGYELIHPGGGRSSHILKIQAQAWAQSCYLRTLKSDGATTPTDGRSTESNPTDKGSEPKLDSPYPLHLHPQ